MATQKQIEAAARAIAHSLDVDPDAYHNGKFVWEIWVPAAKAALEAAEAAALSADTKVIVPVRRGTGKGHFQHEEVPFAPAEKE